MAGEYLSNLDGSKITPIPSNIISMLEKITGQDISDYDTVLINLYPIGRTLGWHTDVTEDYRNLDRDIISVSIGANADFTFSNTPNNFISGEPTSKYPANKIMLNSGDVITFGNESRLITHTVTNVSGNTNLGSIDLSNSNVNEYFKGGLTLKNWRMNFTFRVADNSNNKGKRFIQQSEVETPIQQIYSQLGNKTQSENVVIVNIKTKDGKYDREANFKEAKTNNRIYSMEINSDLSFSNPWASFERKGTIKTNTTKEAVINYIDWLTTDKFKNVKPERRKWILDILKSGQLKNRPIQYYAELKEPSHTTALDYLINKYDWNKQSETQTKITIKDRIDILENELKELENLKKDILIGTPEVLIATNLPKITPDSATKETGGKIGVNKDINPNLISKNGVSVERAAEDINNDYPDMDIQTIRNYIIDILQTGVVNFVNSYTNQNRIDSIKNEIT